MIKRKQHPNTVRLLKQLFGYDKVTFTVLLLVRESHRASLDRNEVWPSTYTGERLQKSHNNSWNCLLYRKREKNNKNKTTYHIYVIVSRKFILSLTSLPFQILHLFLFSLIFIYLACCVLVMACRIFNCGMQTLNCGTWDQAPWPGIELGLPALGTQSFSHWTTRKVPASLSNILLCPQSFLLSLSV